MKCHGCEKEIEHVWIRGNYCFCSQECRAESQKNGEPLGDPPNYEFPLGVGDEDVVFIKPGRAEP